MKNIELEFLPGEKVFVIARHNFNKDLYVTESVVAEITIFTTNDICYRASNAVYLKIDESNVFSSKKEAEEALVREKKEVKKLEKEERAEKLEYKKESAMRDLQKAMEAAGKLGIKISN